MDFQPSARVIADSVSASGHRLTTLEVRMHRFVLAEFNTHRMFSRNSASSRAIPVVKTFAALADEPAVPLAWPAEQRGMQGGDELPERRQATVRRIWLAARDAAVQHAEQLAALGVHKSVVNRLLEPFSAHTVIVTATEWEGFFAQRCSPLAQPEIRAAAVAMRAAYEGSTPTEVDHGDWHLPYVTADEQTTMHPSLQCRVSAARCARVSYLTHDGRHDASADLDLYHRLVGADPAHASPLEHVATPARTGKGTLGNLTGWHQLRHLVLGE